MTLKELLEGRFAWPRNLKQGAGRGAEEAREEECPSCRARFREGTLAEALRICPSCGARLAMPPMERIGMIADPGSFRELFASCRGRNPLRFPGYEEKLKETRKKTGEEDAFISGTVRISGKKAAVGILDGRFLMGSMGTAVGEKIAALAEYADHKKLPLIIFSASGGARMREGLFSLMQMAKTAGAVDQYRRNGGFFVSCLTNPTTGGVSASYASLGDIIIAEPGALIGFAGPRVIRQTIRQELPEGFQQAEFQLEHGMLDMIVDRDEMKDVLSRLISLHEGSRRHGFFGRERSGSRVPVFTE